MPFIIPLLIGAAIGAAATWTYLQQQKQNANTVSDEIELDAQDITVNADAESQVVPDTETTT